MSINEYAGELKVFTWDHEEWVIASDPEDAAKVYAKHIGEQFTTPSDDMATWEEEPPGKIFKLVVYGRTTEDTFAGFVRRIGQRGYFASANY